MEFQNDSKDRKRRFFRGLNVLLGNSDLEQDLCFYEALKVGVGEFRNRLANTYCLDLTQKEIGKMIKSGITTVEFTEIYCKTIYDSRGNVDLDKLIENSLVKTKEGNAIDCRTIDRAPKYGLNGSEWCDVAEGPCSCGAWHK